METGAAASSNDVLPNRGDNDSVRTGGILQYEVPEQATGMSRHIFGTEEFATHLHTPTSYHMHQLPARLRDVGVDENFLQKIMQTLR